MMDGPGRPRGWASEKIYAEVLATGVEREILDRTTYGGLAGSPRVVYGRHKATGGIHIRLTKAGRDVGREFIVPPSAIKWEVDA